MGKETRSKKSVKIELYQPANSNSYTVESLAITIPGIRLIYEHTFRHRSDGDIEIKRINAYSRDPSLIKPPLCPEYFELDDFYKVFGDKAKLIFKVLQKKAYVRLDGRKVRVNQKAKLINPESFNLGFSDSENKEVLNKLNTVLWRRISMTRDRNNDLDSMAESLFTYQGSTVIGNKDGVRNYKFRIGHTILSVEFLQDPSIELLELVSLRILLIFQEQLQNFFHASAIQNYDKEFWFRNKNKRKLFYDIVATFLYHSWNPFDLEECVILIKSGTGLYHFANGRFTYRFDYDGTESSLLEDVSSLDREIQDNNMEFIQYDIDIGMNREKMVPILMTIYLKSRSSYNVDPRINGVSHHYIKMFIESVGKLIDVIIPIIQKEKTLEALKWKTFYDKIRISGHQIGENLDKVLYESVKIMKFIYKIQDVVIYSDDPTILDMISVFRHLDENPGTNYDYRYHLMSEMEIRDGNYICCNLNETVNERIVFYFKTPVIYKYISGQYLSGTSLYFSLIEMAEFLGIDNVSELTKIISKSFLYLNLTLTMSESKRLLKKRFPDLNERKIEVSIEKLLSRFSDFFTLLDTINININSSISAMRGSRDSLTGLYNRQTLNRTMEKYFNTYQSSGPGFGVMFIDMDSFKIYNDTVNHSFGDKLIIRLAEHLLKGQRDLNYESVPSRFGGDEFCFGINEIKPEDFEKVAFTIFASITHQPMEVIFYIGDYHETGGFEINLLSFLHRFIRPDIGGERGEITGYTEKENESPREHIVNIFIHYLEKGNPSESNIVKILGEALMEEHLSEKITGKIVETLSNKISRKIINNHILKEIDDEFEQIIRMFLTLQLENKTTGEIRNELIGVLGIKKLERTLFQRVSIGLSHSSEDRLRSVSSIFKQADARSYLAKQNGKNCVFGINNKIIERSYKNEISILIIDDEPDYIEILQRILKNRYHWPNVYNFMSEKEGSFSFKKLQNIDVIILDLQLYSDEDFNVILAYLKGVSENRELQIIVNSGFVDQKSDLLEKLQNTDGLKVIAVLNKSESVYEEIDRILSERFNIAI
jgi:diguanylate cyclase (GGDEF)-like protein